MRPPSPSPIARAALAACSLLAVCQTAPAADEAGTTGEGRGKTAKVAADVPRAGVPGEWVPPLRPASDQAERAIAAFKVAPDLKVKLWAAEPMMANPNALCTDERGRLYVAETYRYHGGVIDIRGAMNWLDEDIACRTVEDRVAMVNRHANDPAGKEALLSKDSDRIVLLEDATGAGKATKATVFATNFNRVEDGLGSGVFAYHGSVYYTCIPSLWRLRDTKGAGTADVKEELQYGYGVRYAFLGHDLHGMVMGPDGRLYFSIGDRGANVTKTPDGRTVQNIENGAVFRCELDGTGLEVFATGLRNPQELRFDQFGNLFTGDNNPDKGDPARWVYVIEDGDSGWREGYQSAEHMANGGPWMAEQLWAPEANGNALYINPCVSPMGAGPSGLAYYPGTGLPARFDDRFFLCDFRGNKQGSFIRTIQVKNKGASFEVAEEKPFIEHVCATDCEFAVDGGLYVSDWIDGWARPMAGRIYKVYDPKAADDPLVKETQKLIAEGMEKRPVEELVKLLGHKDMRVRQEAQFALAAKGQTAVAALTPVAQRGEALLPRLHAVWAMGQVGRKSPEALTAVVPLLGDKELEVRCQAAKALGDNRVDAAYDGLVKLLQDPDNRARFFAAQALGKIGNKKAVPAIVAVLRENADKDATLRYTCAAALAKLRDSKALRALDKDDSRAVRLGAVLALRKMESAGVAEFLDDADGQVVLEAARAINDLPIESAVPQLAAMINKPLPAGLTKAERPAASQGPKPTGTPADWVLWRVVNANFRVGTPESARALAAFAAREDVPTAVRIEALHDLGDWAKPGRRDHITNLFRPLPDREGTVARDAAAPALDAIAKKAPNEVRGVAATLMRHFGLGDPATLAATVSDPKATPEVRIAALGTLADNNDPRLGKALQAALADKSEALRVSAIAHYGDQPNSAQTLVDVLNSAGTPEKQAALQALGTTPDPAAEPAVAQWMERLLKGQVPPELQLDLIEAAAKRKSPSVQQRLKEYEAGLDPKDPLSPYRACLAGGNVADGHKIFRERADVSCIRCHTAQGEGGIVGPRLDGIGVKQTREYLLESIVNPNAKIAPGFESVIVKTKDNKFRVGVVKKDDDKELVLMNPDAEPDKQVITIPKADIVTRERGPSAMPEGLIKTLSKQDVRDVVEWLASLKEQPKDQAAADGRK